MQTLKNLKPAGILAVIVIAVLLLGSVGLLGRAVIPDQPRALPTARSATTPEPRVTETAPPPTPVLDTDAAWDTFMRAVYLADAIPDYGSDLSQYPASQAALSAGLTDVTSDPTWIAWGTDVFPDCARQQIQCWVRRLAEFGPRQIKCTGTVCEASVSVTSRGVYGFWASLGATPYLVRQAETPEWQDATPLRLLVGTVEYRPDTARWLVTRMTVMILPELPADTP